MEWARIRGYIIFTHDLDFGSLLAATGVDTRNIAGSLVAPTSHPLSCKNASNVNLSGKEVCAPGFVAAKAPAAAPHTTA
ncbi:hypothetical protein NIES22_54780 [Calothrix brevissima NIES-22]|nr:hypothetical protein NIES22_54780 [Calothrix brevissima NIES-22]